MSCHDPYEAERRGREAARYHRDYTSEHREIMSRAKYEGYDSCERHYADAYNRERRYQEDIRREEAQREEQRERQEQAYREQRHREAEAEEYYQQQMEEEQPQEEEHQDRSAPEPEPTTPKEQP